MKLSQIKDTIRHVRRGKVRLTKAGKTKVRKILHELDVVADRQRARAGQIDLMKSW